PSLLTGIAINGQRYSTYAYRSDRRAVESGLTGGEERDTFEYGANTTTVTSATGQRTTYTFVARGGALMLTQTSRASTPTWGANAASRVYDGNGYADYELDWNGNKTDYTYSIGGLTMGVTTAAGTGAQRSESNAWSGINLVEKTFKDATGGAYLKVNY